MFIISPKVTEEYRQKKVRHILNAASKVFVKKGYTATTMQDVIEEANISRGGLYVYFSSTEEMLKELIKEFDQGSIKWLLKSQNDSCSSVWETIETFLKQLVQGLDSIEESIFPATLEFYISGWWEKATHDYEVNRYKIVSETFKMLFKKGVKIGEFKPNISIEVISDTLMTFINGISLGAMALGSATICSSDQVSTLRSYLLWALQIDIEKEGNLR